MGQQRNGNCFDDFKLIKWAEGIDLDLLDKQLSFLIGISSINVLRDDESQEKLDGIIDMLIDLFNILRHGQ